MASTRRRARDTSIRTYRAKRDFAVTGEPAPGAQAANGADLRGAEAPGTSRRPALGFPPGA